MADVLAPNVNNYKKGGATVLFQRTGTTGYVDLGNLPDFAQSLATQNLEHKTARSGKLIVDRREQLEAGFSFKIGQDEMNAANLALVLNAATPAAFSQSSGTAATKQFVSPVLGPKYKIGAYRITNLVVQVGATTKTAGTDYSVELDTGMIRFLPTGTILTSDTVDLTFNKPAIAGESVSPLSNAGILKGSIIIAFRMSDGDLWIFEHTTASVSYEGDMALQGAEFAKASGIVTIEPDYSQTDVYGKWTMMPAAA